MNDNVSFAFGKSPKGDIAGLRKVLPHARISTDPADLEFYGQDWTRHWKPRASAVVFPEKIQEIEALVHWARGTQTALVPSGGRTGLSGGAVAANGEVVVSMQRMNRVIAMDLEEPTITVQAGMVTQRLQEIAREQGYYYPVDFASRGSSHLGGNIATNAGGIKVLRYGMTRDWVAGLTIVTGKGDVLSLNRGLAKNATGFDLRHLLIGSEGTLGFVVDATMRLTRPPPQQQVMVLAVASVEALAETFKQLSDGLVLSAYEFFSEDALRHVVAAGLRRPFESIAPYYVLVEFDENQALATELFEATVAAGNVMDGVLSQSNAQAQALWLLRESITESLAPKKPYKCDISVRRSDIAEFMRDVTEKLAPALVGVELVWFGHFGDGNLHLSVLAQRELKESEFNRVCAELTESLCLLLADHGGSISAEHGVGLLKKAYLHHTRSLEEIQCMQGIKRAFDPDGIMNPGKIFDLPDAVAANQQGVE